MINVYLDGEYFSRASDLAALAHLKDKLASNGIGADRVTVDEDAVAAEESVRHKVAIRKQIKSVAGDTETLLGVTADATQILMFGLSSLIASLATAQSLADVRAAAEPFADLCNGFLQRVENGETRLPYKDKELDTVVADIEHSATAVANVLSGANGG